MSSRMNENRAVFYLLVFLMVTLAVVFCVRVKDASIEGVGLAAAGMRSDLNPTGSGAATLVSPSGRINGYKPSYIWNAVQGSTDYYLRVADSRGERFAAWYTSVEAGCASGTATCSVTPSWGIPLRPGPCMWWIQTYDASGYGPWSEGLEFTVTVALTWPYGTIIEDTPTYIWERNPFAEWYLLWVSDSTGDAIQQWYTAAEAGCPVGTSTTACKVTPDKGLAPGAAEWWIMPWSSADGDGPWSDGMAFVVTLPSDVPGKATLISPSGTFSNSTRPDFKWNAVSESTWYYLWVEDNIGQRIQLWYTSAEAGCAAGTGTCGAWPFTRLDSGAALAPGSARWWVQTWNEKGYGPWSDPQEFNMGVSNVGFTKFFGGIGTTCNEAQMGWIYDAGCWVMRYLPHSPDFCAGLVTEGIPGQWSTLTYDANFADLDFQAVMTRKGEDFAANALYVRASGILMSNRDTWSGMPSNYLSLQYTRDGRVAVMKRVGGADEVPLLPWTDSPAVNKGDASNTVRVKARGSDFEFSINGNLIWKGNDWYLGAGRVGMGMWTQNGGSANGFTLGSAVLTVP